MSSPSGLACFTCSNESSKVRVQPISVRLSRIRAIFSEVGPAAKVRSTAESRNAPIEPRIAVRRVMLIGI